MITNFMGQAKGLAKNPLGIIALFISLIYGFACLVLSTSISNLTESSERLPLIWFIIAFPIIILVGFVYLVTKHHQKLYSPTDYRDSESFLKTFEESKKFESVQVDVIKEKNNETKKPNKLVEKFEDINLNKGIFSDKTKENVKMANDFFNEFLEKINNKPYRDKLKLMSFGAQAPEYFTLSLSFLKKYLKEKNTTSTESVIIRVTKDENGELNMIGIGKDIIEKDHKKFTDKMLTYIDDLAFKRLAESEK